VAAKIELHNAMLVRRVGKYRLGTLLDWHLPQADRLVDFRRRGPALPMGIAAVHKKTGKPRTTCPSREGARYPLAIYAESGLR